MLGRYLSRLKHFLLWFLLWGPTSNHHLQRFQAFCKSLPFRFYQPLKLWQSVMDPWIRKWIQFRSFFSIIRDVTLSSLVRSSSVRPERTLPSTELYSDFQEYYRIFDLDFAFQYNLAKGAYPLLSNASEISVIFDISFRNPFMFWIRLLLFAFLLWEIQRKSPI
jgi:hypothetical protein